MELGLLTMRKGELARFLFKPTYAYGALGCPPLIPPNATVLFEIELLDFLDSAESDKFCALSAVSSGTQTPALHRDRMVCAFGGSRQAPLPKFISPASTRASLLLLPNLACLVKFWFIFHTRQCTFVFLHCSVSSQLGIVSR